ncbi:hypothetical protein CRE_08420 [Caenorhabditis remanei]|uniref:Uncharacterized protein n=1 Tax=Caenorhabditis remanei TaxID=31234 RepID=E3MPM9_CAERE|nr:hypothetical protein CRE_08420 [Caenorhabditis remanei]
MEPVPRQIGTSDRKQEKRNSTADAHSVSVAFAAAAASATFNDATTSTSSASGCFCQYGTCCPDSATSWTELTQPIT